MKKVLYILTGLFILIILAAQIIGFHGANGGLLTFIKGQFPSRPGAKAIQRVAASSAEKGFSVTLEGNFASPSGTVDRRYISFAIDSSQVTGGKWWNPEADGAELGSGTVEAPPFDFTREKLRALMKPFAPAILRIGGSEADKIYYDMDNRETTSTEFPEAPGVSRGVNYHSVLTAAQWDNLAAFAADMNFSLLMTLNTGPSSRNETQEWISDNAEELLRYAAEKGDDVAIWELGNELNLFWYIYGPDHQVSIEQYRKDMKKARELVKKYHRQSSFSGQGSAYWPLLGEPLSFFFEFSPGYIREAGDLSDYITFHYYPQQSRRGAIASRRAHPTRMLNPDYLDEVAHWAKEISQLRDNYAPGTPLMLGESGNAQFGGEPGVSDTYIGGLWWLDQLGLMATMGYSVVVRQSMTGMNYGLLREDDLFPRPDYWNSLLWKQLMGQKVYEVEKSEKKKLRAYAHATEGREGHVTLLLINLDHEKNAEVTLPAHEGDVVIYHVTTDDTLGDFIFLNGKKIEFDGAVPDLRSMGHQAETDAVTLFPLTYAFVVMKPAEN